MRLLTRAIAVETLLALFIALDPSSAAAQAPAPEPDPIQNVGASDAAQTDPAQPRRPSEAEVAADTELGQMIAVELGKVLGVALSPAVGLAAIGLWYRATSDQPERYWYASWWFIATMASLALMVGAKDVLGSAAGPAKQIADGAEVLLNNGAGLIALAASVSWVIEPLSQPVSELAQGGLDFLIPTAHAATGGTAAGAPGALATWLGAGLLASLTTLMFSVVWLVSQTFNIMIMLNPFSPLDPLLKAARLGVIGSLLAACALAPWLGIPFALLLVLFSCVVSAYCARMLIFGTVMAWDLARGARETPIPERGQLAFAGRELDGVPTRRLGRLARTETGATCFRYRPWIVMSAREVVLDGTQLFAVDGSLYPSLYSDREGRARATLDLPPRARGMAAPLAAHFTLAGAGDSWLTRRARFARESAASWVERARTSWSILVR